MDPEEAPQESEREPPSLRATTSVPPPPRRAPRMRLAALAIGAAAIATLGVVEGARLASASREGPPPVLESWPAAARARYAPPSPPPPRADADLDRDGHSWCSDGALVVLPDFASADGAFDVVVHFHGTTEVVTQSLAAVKLNAVAIVFNLGIGSGVYETRFAYGPRLDDVLDLARAALEKRGLATPHVRRVALSAFSAGFGGVLGLLERPDGAHGMDEIDAVMLLDGLHAGFDEHHAIDLRRIEPLIAFARAATRGEKLFYVTHSDIGTYEYASTHATSDAVLAELGVTRQDGGEKPASPDLPVLRSPSVQRDLRPLEPLSHAEKGSFFVRGYAGDRAENHLSHLDQMGATALPELAKRWSRDAAHR
ncbi:MAG TPA: hypothetical protein VGM56_06935 [Byssovorax sp.]|jgi:hypothetical protein|nr:hypothetical protein [Polyangia bacterium]